MYIDVHKYTSLPKISSAKYRPFKPFVYYSRELIEIF